MDDEILKQKIALCEEALSALEKTVPESYDDLFDDPLLLPAIERYFQLLVDAAVDCNNAVLEMRGVDRAETYYGTFSAMRDNGLLPPDVSDALAPSVGLRNALVHRYENIDRRRMHASVKKFLPLYREHLAHLARAAA